jgi:hypothetical protein
MAILSTDVKLLESQRMADTTDGGGRMTQNEVPDGVAGNVFPKVARTDSVYGRVNLRKLYAAIRTATLDTYAGAHCIITRPPVNDKINCLLFSTDSHFDTRTEARDRIESYVVKGPLSRMRLYGNQVIGQKALTLYQRVEEALPDVGEVIVLSVESGVDNGEQQFCRITDVAHEVRTFTDTDGDFQRRVITLTIGSSLGRTFTGAEVSRFSADTSPTKVRVTQVADASRYYGVKPLAEAVSSGAFEVKVPDVFAPLVPSTNRETAVSLAEIGGAGFLAPIKASALTDTYIVTTDSVSINPSSNFTMYTSRRIKPNTLSLTPSGVGGSDIGDPSYDDGEGEISGGYLRADIDYETGAITNIRTTSASMAAGSLQFRATYTPVVEFNGAAHTREVPVTLGTRGTVYVETLDPLPMPGTTIVEYRALGRWYRLRDNGEGVLVANNATEGSGSVDYTTGALIVTLGALPDVESAVLLAWGSPLHTTIRAGGTSDAGTSVRQTIQLTDLPVNPGAVSISYVNGSTTYTANADAAGDISGGGLTGSVNHTTGLVEMEYTTRLPNYDTEVTVNYEQLVPTDPEAPTVTVDEFELIDNSADTGHGWVEGSVAFAAVATLTYETYSTTHSHPVSISIRDNGSGLLTIPAQAFPDLPGLRSLQTSGNSNVGTIDYVTGEVTLVSPSTTIQYLYYHEGLSSNGWQIDEATVTVTPTQSIQIAGRTGASGTGTAKEAVYDLATAPLKVDLTRTVSADIMPGSVTFKAMGKTYIDRNGVLYTDLDYETGSGLAAGSINYANGECLLTYYTNGASLSLSVTTCLTTYGDFAATRAFFRTAGSPIRPASLYVQALSLEGELITGTSDQNGSVTGTFMRGTIQQNMGVVSVEFGEMVTAAGNELERWYDEDNVEGSEVWRPLEILPETLRYNCVVLTSLPLSADILGLDPVRLPMDGKVPIYRPADIVVIHESGTDTLENPLTAGTPYELSQTDLASAYATDSLGVLIPDNQYAINLTTGVLTTAADLNLAGYTQPVKVVWRIEDMSLLSDVQINGQLSLTAALTHDYSLDAYVSSALLQGDLFAHVSNVFDQISWTSVWSDTRIGSDATATYNSIDFPIEVLNDGAVQERWRLNFTSPTAFQIIGESLGVVGTGTTSADISPENPLTGLPYFTLRADGFGTGWSAGNQLRFNTFGANSPIWISRTILAGASLSGDEFHIEERGDVD